MQQPTLVIMAAGIGSRFGGLKQLAPVGKNEEPIIHFSLYDAIDAGFQKVVFIIKQEIDADFRR
ncbi:MAG: NTP transferase domain-containing protein, partial [Eubacteriales bacterium]|nr:NTP transferase domain-containing protein [Eubacteriales bacterium]MDD3350726.1 NTP transferase domain-containing protein [Eubacteriales bacterium]